MSLLTPVGTGPKSVPTTLTRGEARPHQGQPPGAGLTIRISAGVGTGRTRLSAFDAALCAAGVGDFNLVRLSSVIPPASEVVELARGERVLGRHGDRLYCVYAEAYASTPVTHHDLQVSLSELSERRGGRFVEAGSVTVSAECVDHPVCAVVIASYAGADWAAIDPELG